MLQQYDAIYLSPHLDDVALSCGGQIHQLSTTGRSVLIVTIMAGNPPSAALSGFARELHDRWQLASKAVEARRQEDAAACRVLGSDFIHWEIPDCIYRRDDASGLPLYSSEEALFDSVHPSEVALVAYLAKALAGLPASTRVLVPLGIGNHVDHQLTRMAAELHFGISSLYYYEDYPYARDGCMLEALLSKMDGWQSEVVPIGASALAAKQDAVAAYKSQLDTFFADEEDMREQLSQFTKQKGGERLWSR